MTLEYIFALLSDIPLSIYVGILTITGTLTGIFISNISNTSRLKKQLQHDSRERKNERLSKLRQEIYLSIAEEMGKTNLVLGNLASIDLQESNPSNEIQGLMTAISKAEFVAEPQTSSALRELGAAYAKATVRLMSAAGPCSRCRTDINIAKNFARSSRDEATKYLTILNEMHESGQFEKKQFEILNKKLDFHNERATKYSDEINEAYEMLFKHQDAYNQNLISEMKTVTQVGIKAIVAARSDLDIPVDIEHLKVAYHDQWNEMEQELESFMTSLKNSH